MILLPPFCISARLLTALQIGDSWLSFDPVTVTFYLDTPDWDEVIVDFRPGARGSVQDCFEGILAFMDAAAEAQNSVDRGRFSDNADIFEPHIMLWCQENDDEIGQLRWELEETKGLIA